MDGLARSTIHSRHAQGPSPIDGARAVMLTLASTIAMSLIGCGGSSAAVANDAADASTSSETAEITDALLDSQRAPKPGDACVDRSQCDDGIVCNGVEECLAKVCTSARNVACRDPGGCATSTCDEALRGCVVDVPATTTCASTDACLPELGCTKVDGCTTERDARCDDGRACTDDRCDVSRGVCLHVPDDGKCPSTVGACGAGVCVGAGVADPSGCGALPDASRCAAEEGCDTAMSCVALKGACTRDDECSDASSCDGRERCLAGRCVHGDPARCVAKDACHHVTCRDRALGDAYCVNAQIPGCS